MPAPHLSAIPQDDAADADLLAPVPSLRPLAGDIPPGLPMTDVDPGDMSEQGE